MLGRLRVLAPRRAFHALARSPALLTATTPPPSSFQVPTMPEGVSAEARAARFEEVWGEPLPLTQMAMDALEWTHNMSGLPWWQTLALWAVGVRMLTVPFWFMSLKNGDAVRRAGGVAAQMQQYLQVTRADKDAEAVPSRLQIMKYVAPKVGASVTKFLLPFTNVAALLTVSFGVRRMAITSDAFAGESVSSWIPSLAEADPSLILPGLSAAGIFLSLQLPLLRGKQLERTPILSVQRGVDGLFRAGQVWTLVTFPIFAKLPAAIFCYTVPSIWLMFLTAYIGRTDTFRQRVLKVPPLPSPFEEGEEDRSPQQALAKSLEKLDLEALVGGKSVGDERRRG